MDRELNELLYHLRLATGRAYRFYEIAKPALEHHESLLQLQRAEDGVPCGSRKHRSEMIAWIKESISARKLLPE